MTGNAESLGNQIKCPVCGHMNRHGSLVCENCGSLLNLQAQSRRATRDLRDAAVDLNEEERSAVEEDPGIKVRGAEYREGVSVQLRVDESTQPVVVSPDMLQRGDVILGRRDPITEQVPEVDLDRFAGYRMGVSRRHSSINLTDGVLTITDLGSSNGTYVNGNRLEARKPEPILDGDLLRLGQIIMTVKFIDS